MSENCRFCGAEIPEGAVYCPSCGRKIGGKTVEEVIDGFLSNEKFTELSEKLGQKAEELEKGFNESGIPEALENIGQKANDFFESDRFREFEDTVNEKLNSIDVDSILNSEPVRKVGNGLEILATKINEAIDEIFNQ
ncbi:MAG: zinc ribbon domain-containing protein [Clostridia bacterium]|jgi:uncharacterized Zn finger protein (UPF0148 family)|nr:zinc ribbon domain-containing protein [Clostridia bacterium]